MKAKLEELGLIVVVVATLILIVGGVVAYENWAYHDWTCAFKKCVQVDK